MALIPCPECGKEVSDRSPRCIHCGYPLGKRGAKRSALLIIAVIAALVLAAAVYCGSRLQGGLGLSLPFGLKPDMTPEQLHEQMQAQGFVPDFETGEGDRLEYVYQPAQVYGQEAYMTVLSTGRQLVEVAHLYQEEEAFGAKKLSPLFTGLREMLVAEYGLPTHEAMGECAWEDGAYAIRLYYVGDTGGSLWLDTVYQP